MRYSIVLCVLAALLGPTAFACADEAPEEGFSDEAVLKAVRKGVAYLCERQDRAAWSGISTRTGDYGVGPTALCAYALQESLPHITDAELRARAREAADRALEWLAEQETDKTYALGLRCQAYLSAIRRGKPYRKRLAADVRMLVNSTSDGSYGYHSRGKGRGRGDNSNSQYGLLGVWAGQMAGLSVPVEYWETVYKHWRGTQCEDGGWVYVGKQATSVAGMATAGAASMYVCFDNMLEDEFLGCELGPRGQEIQKSMDRAMDWFAANYLASLRGSVPMGQSDMLYYLYGVERVGVASGHKYFGEADWYRSGAAWLIREQDERGRWSGYWGSDVGTSFALLFLVRGRQPILLNKLAFDGDWNNRPRDLASLTRWLSGEYERELQWQIVNLDAPPREWCDAPILYVSGSKAPEFSDDDIARMRRYVHQGGTIFSVTECRGDAFAKGMREAYGRMFPEYELTPVGEEHDVYSRRVGYELARRAGKLGFEVISNGIRPLAIHTDVNLSRSWQARRDRADAWAFEAAGNVCGYVTGSTFRRRGVHSWPKEQATAGLPTVTLARVAPPGFSDPEPLAYERFSRLMARDHKVHVEVVGPMSFAELAESDADMAVFSGLGEVKLTGEDRTSVRAFVQLGRRLLLIEAIGGDEAFAESAERELRILYGTGSLRRMDASDPLFALPGHEIRRFEYRQQTRRRITESRPHLRAVYHAGRPAVLYSAEDITAGLVGYPSYTCDGYSPETGFRIMRNIVLFVAQELAERRAPEREEAPAPGGAE